MKRRCWVLVHRYAGLATALFLTVAGLTGSVISFNHELDEWLNPQLYTTASRGEPLPVVELIARVEHADPGYRVTYVPLHVEPGHTVGVWGEPRIDSETGKPYALDYNQVFADPVTGKVIGKRLWGGCCLARANLIPFLYRLHYTLYLPEKWGLWLMGIVAIIWIFDNFVGAYLTFPSGKVNNPSETEISEEGMEEDGTVFEKDGEERSWWQRWKPSWRIKSKANPYRLNFDLHRAGGLWFWGLLLIMAVSAVSLNLHEEVFEPVVSAIWETTPTVFDQRKERSPDRPIEPTVSLGTILAKARAEAMTRNWDPHPHGVFYNPSFGLYGVGFGDEHAAGLGSPWIYFDGSDGGLIGDWVPGRGTPGDLFIQIQFPLHSGQIAGLTGRIVICVTGLAVAILSVTGIVIWLRKRRSRSVARIRNKNLNGCANVRRVRHP